MEQVQDVVLLTVVGDRDPFPSSRFCPHCNEELPAPPPTRDSQGREVGPILSYLDRVFTEPAWQMLKPMYAYLLHTAGEKRVASAAEVRDEMLARGVEATCCPLDLGTENDPTDFTVLLREMGRWVHTIATSHPDAKFTVLVSPGTPQMSAVWLVLGNEGRLAGEFYQTKEGRHGGIRKIVFEPLFEVELIHTALDMLDRYDFEGASRQLKNLARSPNPHRVELCRFMSELFAVLACWNRLHYDKAHAQLKQIGIPPTLSSHSQYGPLLGIVATMSEVLAQLKVRDTKTVVLDLLSSAERCKVTARDMDCLWRCTTAYEVMLTGALADCGLQRHSDERAHEMEERLLGHSRTVRKTELPGAATPDPRMQAVANSGLNGVLFAVRRQRNEVLHRGRWRTSRNRRQPPDELPATKQAVQTFLGLSDQDFTKYPLSIQALRVLRNQVQALFTRHP